MAFQHTSAVGSPAVILLVEDDDAIRTLTKRVLEMQGFVILEAGEPRRALTLAAEYPGKVDILVSDVQLPGMDGREMFALLRAQRPELKVVFISGYPREEVLGLESEDCRVEFLAKPFSPFRLAEMLHHLLSHTTRTA